MQGKHSVSHKVGQHIQQVRRDQERRDRHAQDIARQREESISVQERHAREQVETQFKHEEAQRSARLIEHNRRHTNYLAMQDFLCRYIVGTRAYVPTDMEPSLHRQTQQRCYKMIPDPELDFNRGPRLVMSEALGCRGITIYCDIPLKRGEWVMINARSEKSGRIKVVKDISPRLQKMLGSAPKSEWPVIEGHALGDITQCKNDTNKDGDCHLCLKTGCSFYRQFHQAVLEKNLSHHATDFYNTLDEHVTRALKDGPDIILDSMLGIAK